MKIRTIDDFDIKGKTVLLRVDMNVPIDSETKQITGNKSCLLYTSPSPRDATLSRMPAWA